ncbi:sigma 54-interacting transcriptional regulator [Salicibibacter cibarius]|uniref:HTH-type transcriptional regulatory protein TyrR n=1 Tax=Salicibibacter cibarius TaxID=2743000 RepID=A0A7T6Z417_9BACI|nr:sigma 54-interacting transcriptional regulator [Salicibibacter cibarius]QQK76402.1 sigma 54-interacting transcriptional regulator [Salicibibacter cibarius]
MTTKALLSSEWSYLPFPMLLVNDRGEVIARNERANEDFHRCIKEGEHHFACNVDGQDYLVEKYEHSHMNNYFFYFFYPRSKGAAPQKYEEMERELNSLLESAYDAIYITDAEGTTLKTNPAIERITKIPRDYYIGKNVNQLVQRGILEESVTFRVVEEKKPVTVYQRGQGDIEVMLTGSPIFNKDGEVEKVITNIRDLTDLKQLRDENQKMKELNSFYKAELNKMQENPDVTTDIVCESAEMKNIFFTGERVANIDATILVLGETGVGKDVFAKNVHEHSLRSEQGEFIKINCGAIPPTLLESELFGYEAGAFSGAQKTGKAGMFELADHGTLFLDEIGELPLELQVKLLRVLQEGELRRVGSTNTTRIDVRVIAATNRDLKKMVKEGTFREDLYYRINVIPIHIPPLRERREDILALIYFYLNHYNEKYDVTKKFSESALNFFYQFDWHGNVRELANLVERLVVTIPTNMIDISDIPVDIREETGDDGLPQEITTLQEATEHSERALLAKALKLYENTYKIADALGTSQATIVRKLKKYEMT